MNGRAAGHRYLQEKDKKKHYEISLMITFLLIILCNKYCTHYQVPYIFPVHGHSILNSNNTFYFILFFYSFYAVELNWVYKFLLPLSC